MYKKPKCSSFDELNVLLQKVRDKAGKEFDQLVSNFKINLQQNKSWAANYYSLVNECKKLNKSIKRLKVWRWILLIPLVFPFILMTNSLKKKKPLYEEKCKERDKTQADLEKQLREFATNLSYEFAYDTVINQAWDDVKINTFLNKSENANWDCDYSLYMTPNSYAADLISGRMFEHPFILMNKKDQGWHPHVYTGSLPVTYTVHVNGKTETRTEIVVATVTLPEPDWTTYPKFLYKSSKPLELNFQNDLSKKKVKKAIKKMEYQAMDNPEFDKIFPASRNNEVQYRVVFTPIAQEGFVNLFKTRQYDVCKVKETTSVRTNLSIIDNDFSDDFDYDLSQWKNKFSNWIVNLVTNIATYSLPIANMPIYYQMTYVDHKGNIPSSLQSQANAHWLCNHYGLWNNFETDAILEPTKFNSIKISKVEFDIVQIKCNYFHPHHRVQLEPRPSQRGVVMVPVHVIDYLPRSKSIYVFNSTNFNTNKKEILFNNWAIHSGQILFYSWSPTPPKAVIDQISKYID